MSGTIPIVMGPAGATPAVPASVQQTLLATVAATNPGYTANLPGTMIEDISSTDVAAILTCDSALVEYINSVTPYGANQFLLNQLGQIYGVQQGQNTNTAVYVVFTGTASFVINPGFVVSDGTYQYIVQDGGVLSGTGTSAVTPPLYCVAAVTGSWAVPASTVTTIITSVNSYITLSVTNPTAGTASTGAETVTAYRSRVLQAGLSACIGNLRYLKTNLSNVLNVQPRLISVIQQGTGFEIIVGGGDPYQVAYAILTGILDITTLVGTQLAITGISNAAAAVVTTNLYHNLTTGSSVTIAGVLGMTGANGTWVATVLSATTFSIPYNSSAAPTYTSGGTISNTRNQVVTLNDYPNIYTITYVVPPLQTVSISLTWNTTSTNSVSDTSMQILGATAIAAYINSIQVGQPINLFELQNAFQLATVSVLPTALLSRMVFAVYIDGYLVAPASGTGIISGDPESYFSTTTSAITITQG